MNIDLRGFFAAHWQKILVLLGVVLAAGVIGLQFWQQQQMSRRAEEARVAAQNALAEMSGVMEENNSTWSRLAQERSDLMALLESRNSELADIIRERNEEIQNLTTAVANIRNVHIVVRPESGGHVEETVETIEGETRSRVDFDQVHEEFIRVSGHTLTNPAEAEIDLEFVRAVNFTVVTTQLDDLSWRSYLSTDFPGMTIGEIETSVNPLSRPAESRGWERDIEVGVYGSGAVTGNYGSFGADIGYDFGPVDINVDLGGIVYPGGTDFVVGGRVGFAPFDF